MMNMRIRTLGLAATLSASLLSTTTTSAFAPHKGQARQVVAATGASPRIHRDVTWRAPAAAAAPLAQLAATGTWQAMWDHDTDVPLRIWGSGIDVPGAMADPAIAETAARRLLADHLALIAPGATAADFVLVANTLGGSGDVRTVGFEQRWNGLRVVGASVGFAFKHDRMIAISSTAAPHVTVALPRRRVDAGVAATRATAWLAQDGIATARVLRQGDRVVLPVIRERGTGAPSIEYRVAEELDVSADAAGRWNVWVDANDGAAIARQATLRYATGSITFDVPDRSPTGTRSPHPAANLGVTIAGQPLTTDAAGVVTWAGAGAAQVTPSLRGPLVAMTNVGGALATTVLQLMPGGTATWSQAGSELADAQLDSFVYVSTAKAFAKARLNPTLAYLDQTISVSVNENMTCNAYSTGDDVHFFRQDSQCENTGRIADVVYHEFGHSLHNNSIIPGAGAFDGSLSEGLADTLGVSITGDHGLGRGFFFNDSALRDLDPVGVEKSWPKDADGEVHDEGEIIGEALWDLRKGLIAKLGEGPGFDRLLKIYYGIMQRASDIPSTFAEALVADDDDGNLANGTPNQCEIIAAFSLHGLGGGAATLGIGAPTRDGFNVSITTQAAAGGCPLPTLQGAVIDWRPRGGAGGQVPLTASGATWSAAIPTQPDGTVVEYKVTLTLDSGATLTYPDNAADPYYQFFVGAVQKLWCADFEAGAADWTHGASPANNDEWAAGAPMGKGGDPTTAHGGAGVFGIDLASDGHYQPDTTQWAESPEIDLQGNTKVRLQYYRWLGVEDGAYDKARILANGKELWTNLASPGQPMSGVEHLDKEWRFQDVDLGAQAATGKVKLRFELTSDPGLEFGGWTMDDVCVVAYGAAIGATCGNGKVETGETCDDGNTTAGDGCSATCQDETGTTPPGGGCCQVGGSPAGATLLAFATLGLLVRSRRRRARA
jgi:cysteine-rich repeat protein